MEVILEDVFPLFYSNCKQKVVLIYFNPQQIGVFIVRRLTQMFTDDFLKKVSVLICENLWTNSCLSENDQWVMWYGLTDVV